MHLFRLLYNPEEEKTLQKRVLPHLQGTEVTLWPFDREQFAAPGEPCDVITWLNDADLAVAAPELFKAGCSLGVLPHPGMKQARLGYGISGRISEAIDDIVGAGGPQLVDLLWCNGAPVFNSVIIGDPFTVSPGTAAVESLWARLRRLISMMHRLLEVVPTGIRICTHRGNSIDTAAIGLVAVEHGRSSTLSRRLLADSAVNDGMLNALVFSPRSALQMFAYLVTSVLLYRGNVAKLPSFVGHIRTEALEICCAKPIAYSVDGQPHSAEVIALHVEKQASSIYPGRQLSMDPEPPTVKESFRIKALPTGEARDALIRSPLPLWPRASTEEFKELFSLLNENARASESYLILMILSALLATVGLLANSAPVIIGAMILAPLMAPIISMSMGLLRQQYNLTLESGKTVLFGIALTLACSMLLTLLTPLRTINSEIGARLSPTLLDLGVAVISGVAAAYAHARSEVARSLAGVAVAVALVPPLAVAGTGVGWFDWRVFVGAFLLFITNLVGIVLAAALTFLFLGFSAFGRAQRGLALSLILVAIVSIPLAAGFRAMVDEHRVVRQLDGWSAEGVTLHDVHIRSRFPMHVSVRMVAEGTIEEDQIARIKTGIEERLGREIILEATLAIVR